MMNTPFKYQRSLKYTELYYYTYVENFIDYFNGFLKEHDLEMAVHEEKSFENCINYLNSISYILVDKFLCAYLFYHERGKKSIMDGFDFYDLKKLNFYEKDSITYRVILKQKSFNYHKILAIKLNKAGIFYTNKKNIFPLFNLKFKTKEDDSRYFINIKDLAFFLNKSQSDLTNKEMKELNSFYRSVIGKPITTTYILK